MSENVWWFLRFAAPILFLLGILFDNISNKWIYEIERYSKGYTTGGTEGDYVPPHWYTVKQRGCISYLALIVSKICYLGAIVGGIAWLPVIISLIENNLDVIISIVKVLLICGVILPVVLVIIRVVWELLHPPWR